MAEDDPAEQDNPELSWPQVRGRRKAHAHGLSVWTMPQPSTFAWA
jgi:hypothetical protein